jgi:hypothetical protein
MSAHFAEAKPCRHQNLNPSGRLPNSA